MADPQGDLEAPPALDTVAQDSPLGNGGNGERGADARARTERAAVPEATWTTARSPTDLVSDEEGDVSHKIAHKKQRAFIAAFVKTGQISMAARNVGIGRRTHYDWLANDPAYCEAFEMAREVAADILLDEARRRAVDGLEKPILYRGKPVLDENGKPVTTRRYSDTLLIFLLKAFKPEVYGDPLR